MTHQQAIDYIHSTLKFGSVLGLDNIRELLGRLGNPQKKLKIIHVGGTNGKGSTCAFITQILMNAGFSVGMYISPFVHEFNERIQIDRENISDSDLAKHTARVKSAIDEMMADAAAAEDTQVQHPTEFEIITAIGFLHFLEQECDYVVLEVGMGGRLDATNVIDVPHVCAITSISLDHMEYLGDTVEKIAIEKCGIIKHGGIAVCYPAQNPAAAQIIEQDCLEKDAIFILPDEPLIGNMDIYGTIFDYGRYKNLQIRLLGEHQVYNAATAIAVVEALAEHWAVEITPDSIYDGLDEAEFPGRFEVIADEPLTIVDGAHNTESVSAFVAGVETYLSDYSRIMVMGMLRDKEYEECIKKVAEIADIFIATTVENPRSLSAEDVAKIAGEYCANVIVAPDKWEALELANDYAMDCGDDGMEPAVCVCGSLYLIGGMN